MSQYKYGMYVKTIAKIKQDIINGMEDESVKDKWSISDGQLGFIHDVLLKKQYRYNERRLTVVENKVRVLMDDSIKVGSQVLCDYPDFGVGTVVELAPIKTSGKDIEKLMWVKFPLREHKTMCNFVTMKTVHDDVGRKLIRLS